MQLIYEVKDLQKVINGMSSDELAKLVKGLKELSSTQCSELDVLKNTSELGLFILLRYYGKEGNEDE